MQQPKQQFPQQNILTPDDGNIGRNMLRILIFNLKFLKNVLNFEVEE
jgi:hypothetical protein